MKRLAIIKDVGFGCRDVGKPVLFFSAYISECAGALQIMGCPAALDFIEEYSVYDVKNLEGKPVWVDMNDSGTIIRVDKPCLIK